MNSPRLDIYRDVVSEPAMLQVEVTRKDSEKYGFDFIDLYPFMKKGHARHGEKFEFDNDSHWIRHGHEFVTRQLLPYL